MADLKNQSAVPYQPHELTSDWLNATLAQSLLVDSGPAVSLTTTPIAKQGATSVVVIVTLQFEQSRDQQLVAKFSSTSPEIRASMFRSYANEVAFYNQFGTRVGFRVPACYFAHYNSSTHDSLILLEFIPEAANVGNQVMSPAQQEFLVEQLASFHATWRDQEDELIGHNIPDGQDDDSLQHQVRFATDGCAVIRDSFAGREGESRLLVLVELWLEHAPTINRFVSSRNRTLCHNDFHSRQFSVPDHPAGEVCVFDWQEPSVGLGTDDLACLLFDIIGKWPDATWPDHTRSLLERYHRKLLENGVSDYSFDEFLTDYHVSVAQLVVRQVGFFGKVGLEPIVAFWKEIDPELDVWNGIYGLLSRLVEEYRVIDTLDAVVREATKKSPAS